MKNLLIRSAAIFFAILMMKCSNNSQNADINEETTELTKQESVKRGEYLVGTAGCDDCHTPKNMTQQGPAPDMTRRLSGFPADAKLAPIVKAEGWVLFSNDLMAAVGPWGTSFAANITPHETGIGKWSYEQFKKSFVEGKHKGLDGGRPVLPPMPWQKNKLLTEQDVRAIYDYLQSLPPIDNVVPSALQPTQQISE